MLKQFPYFLETESTRERNIRTWRFDRVEDINIQRDVASAVRREQSHDGRRADVPQIAGRYEVMVCGERYLARRKESSQADSYDCLDAKTFDGGANDAAVRGGPSRSEGSQVRVCVDMKQGNVPPNALDAPLRNGMIAPQYQWEGSGGEACANNLGEEVAQLLRGIARIGNQISRITERDAGEYAAICVVVPKADRRTGLVRAVGWDTTRHAESGRSLRLAATRHAQLVRRTPHDANRGIARASGGAT